MLPHEQCTNSFTQQFQSPNSTLHSIKTLQFPTVYPTIKHTHTFLFTMSTKSWSDNIRTNNQVFRKKSGQYSPSPSGKIQANTLCKPHPRKTVKQRGVQQAPYLAACPAWWPRLPTGAACRALLTWPAHPGRSSAHCCCPTSPSCPGWTGLWRTQHRSVTDKIIVNYLLGWWRINPLLGAPSKTSNCNQ